MPKARALLPVCLLMALTMAIGISANPSLANAKSDYVVVTPKQSHGWYIETIQCGGELHFISDPTSPFGEGALQLKTSAETCSKVQYLNNESVPLASVDELGYWTKQNSGPPHADPSYQLVVDLNGGGPGGFTTFVYEPYWNGLVVPNMWQSWDVDTGNLWSSRSFTEGTCIVVAGAGGPPFYTLNQLKAMCPNAVTLAFGVNVGTFNPLYDVETDGVNFDGTTYDFEVARGCGRGQGEFRGHHGEGNFAVKAHCEGESDSFSSSNRGDGKSFQSTQVLSSIVDLEAGTITMTGIGSSFGGLPTTFTLVALASGATPGAVSLTFGDGFVNAGDLLSGEVVLE
jgi:hypothetical protein